MDEGMQMTKFIQFSGYYRNTQSKYIIIIQYTTIKYIKGITQFTDSLMLKLPWLRPKKGWKFI